MNVKKMFAATAGMLIVASSLPVSVLGAASYSDELQGAYNYAYSKGITTMSSIDNANMYGELTRGQLAKMISNWAEKELGTKADETKVCSFADAQTAEGDLAAYVKKACQMGLMGQGITSFRPNDKVTRGEFGTTLSRAIWGEKNNGGTPYYTNHLQALKDKGIMTKIENPSQMEIRGYVMLMLERTSKSGVNKEAKCNDPLVTLACTMGSATCPAECKKGDSRPDVNTDTKAGDLTVSVTNKTDNVVSIPGTATVLLGKVKFGGSQKINLASVTVSRVGLGDNSLIKNVWFERNGQRVSNKANITADNEAVIRFNNGFVVEANETLDFVVELQDSTGGEYAFKIVKVDSSAKNVSINPDTTSTFRTTEYRVAQLEVGTLNYVGVDRNGDQQFETAEYRINGNNAYDLGKFTFYNESPVKEDRVIRLQNLNFRNVKGGDLNNFKDWTLLRDGKKIEAKATVDGKYLTFSFADKIEASKTAVYTVMGVPTAVELTDGDQYQLELRNSGDIVAVEEGKSDVGFRVSPYSEYLTTNVSNTTNTIATMCQKYQFNAKPKEDRRTGLSLTKKVYSSNAGVETVNQWTLKGGIKYYDGNGVLQSPTIATTDFPSPAAPTAEAVATTQLNTLVDALDGATPTVNTQLQAKCINELASNRSTTPAQNYAKSALKTHWDAVAGKFVTIKGGNLILTKDAKFPDAVTAGEGYSNVVLAKGKMNISQGVKLSRLVLTRRTGSVDLDKVFQRAWIVVGGKKFSASQGQATGIYPDSLVFDTDFYINKGEHDVELVVNMTKNARTAAGTNPVELNPIKWTDFAQNQSNYVNGEETNLNLAKDGIGQLNVSKLFVQASSISLSKTSTADDTRVVAGNSDTVTLFEGKLTNTLANNADLDNLVLTLRGNVATKFANVWVEINGNAVSSTVPLNVGTTDTEIKVPSLSSTVKPNETVTLTLKALVDGNLADGNEMNGTLYVTAMSDGNRVQSTDIVLSKLKIVGAGSTNILAGDAGRNSVVLVNAPEADIATTVFAVRNDSQTLSSVKFVYKASNAADLPNIKLRNVEVLYKDANDRNATWTTLARVGRFEEHNGTYAANAFTAGAGTSREVSVAIQPTSFTAGKNYQLAIRGSFENYRTNNAPIMEIEGIKLGFPSISAYTDITTNNKRLISVAKPVLSVKEGSKLSVDGSHSFTLLVTKDSNLNGSIKVTGVVTEEFVGGTWTV